MRLDLDASSSRVTADGELRREAIYTDLMSPNHFDYNSRDPRVYAIAISRWAFSPLTTRHNVDMRSP